MHKNTVRASLSIGCFFVASSWGAVPETVFPLSVCEADRDFFYPSKSRQHTKRNRNLYIRLEDAIKKYQLGDLTVVDVRRAVEFMQFRIPGSINLPLHQIKHKAYFRKKHLLLVNDGKSYLQLEMAAEQLENSGFNKVSLIDGGLSAWRNLTQQIDGKAGSIEALRFLSVKEFLSESKHGPWYVVNLGKTGSFKEAVNGEVVDLKLDQSLAKTLNSTIEKRLPQLPRVLFVSDDKQVYKKLSPHLAQLNFANYHILSQTTDYIPEFKKQNRLVYASRNWVADKGCQL